MNTRHARLILSILLTMGLTQPALASDDTGFYYQIGGNLPGISGFAPADYSAPGAWHWSQGGGLYFEANNVYLGWAGSSLFGNTLTKEGHQMSLKGDYGTFQLGYVAMNTPGFQLYPYLGVGLSGFVLRASEDLSPVLNVSQGNLPLTKINGQSWIFEAGVGTHAKLQTSKEQHLVLGLKTGYLFSPFETQWFSNELPVTGGPQILPNGFYAQLILGIGSST